MENQPENAHSTASPSLKPWQVLYGLGGLGLGALIIWASFNANLFDSFGAIMEDPWGVVAIADLYLGFLIFGAFVFLTDGVRPASFAWVIALMFLGNVLAIVWLVLRLPHLASHLRNKSARL